MKPQQTHPAAQTGVSLVELMVAMVIGLVVVGAVFTNYLHNAAGSRQTAALAQVTSDASLVLGIMRNHIALAGYGQPNGSSAGVIQTNFTGPAILGCDHGFATLPTPATTDATCNANATTPAVGNSVLVRYATDSDISPTTTTEVTGVGTVTGPSDCRGTTITAPAGSPAGTALIANSLFQIDPAASTLRCWGNGAGLANYQPLVDNVVSMTLHYGIGEPDTVSGNGKMMRAVRYITAGSVGALNATAWNNVMAVRMCVVVRSMEQVLPSATAYRACDGTVTTPTDRFIYRAFTSTVLINNRLSSRVFDPS